jgi:GNAT superfamily N-acetyltransferase
VNAADRYRLEADKWLGSILERPAWTLTESGSAPLAELARSGPSFATAKIAAAATEEVAALEAIGFRAVDMALTFDAGHIEARPPAWGVRFARSQDHEAVEAIAGSAFRFSRFHLDPRLPRALADKVKAAWAGNWFRGARGDGMVVAEADGRVAGFLQLLWAPQDCLLIDLIAVQPQSARRGVARAMITFAYARGTGDARRPRSMAVGTQAANTPSVRLYESLGFRLRDAKFVLHHHGAQA